MRALMMAALLTASAVGLASELSPQTQQNVEAAMKGEAMAYAKYMLYAQQAREAGRPELARLFETSAEQERLEHFSELAELSGMGGSDLQNLEDAIAGESYETTTMYRDFAEEARQQGDTEAAARFEELRRDEAKHRAAFQKEVSKLEQQSRQ